MNLKDLLADRNIATALIVDDAYDQVPRAEDLEADDDSWANFIADIGEDHDAPIRNASLDGNTGQQFDIERCPMALGTQRRHLRRGTAQKFLRQRWPLVGRMRFCTDQQNRPVPSGFMRMTTSSALPGSLTATSGPRAITDRFGTSCDSLASRRSGWSAHVRVATPVRCFQ